MNKITAEDFWKVMLEPMVPPPPVFYRLYYNKDGSAICYSMEDLPGDYIEVDKETYVVGSYNVRVVDKQLKHIPVPALYTKLRPNTEAGTACDPRDICVVVSEDYPHTKWSMQ